MFLCSRKCDKQINAVKITFSGKFGPEMPCYVLQKRAQIKQGKFMGSPQKIVNCYLGSRRFHTQGPS